MVYGEGAGHWQQDLSAVWAVYLDSAPGDLGSPLSVPSQGLEE